MLHDMTEVARRIVRDGEIAHGSLAFNLARALLASSRHAEAPAGETPTCRRTVAGCCAPEHCGAFGTCALGRPDPEFVQRGRAA